MHPSPDDTHSVTGAITRWLDAQETHGPHVTAQLAARLYGELRGIARRHMWNERDGHTLGVTDVLHESWMRLMEQDRVRWHNRAHFLGVASIMMRRILVNHARARLADKRGNGVEHVTLSEAEALPGGCPDAALMAVHEALESLAEQHERAARLVELRFFGGLELTEAAETLSISQATAKRDWALARAWLARALKG
jgi:RNA polymerase sigma factor (TIGR02999 family)